MLRSRLVSKFDDLNPSLRPKSNAFLTFSASRVEFNLPEFWFCAKLKLNICAIPLIKSLQLMKSKEKWNCGCN